MLKPYEVSNGNVREGKKLKMRNVFDGFISRPDTTEERIGEFEDKSIETTLTKKQRKKS